MNLLFKVIIILKFVVLTGFFLCSTTSQDPVILSRFDIKSDDSQVVFSYKHQEISSIYMYDFELSDSYLIHKGDKDWSYVSPSFMGNNDKILYIKYSRHKTPENYICISDISGEKEECILKPEGITAEVIPFTSEEIVFSQADTVSNSSPIGMKSAKGFDLYKFNINTNDLIKITNNRFYSLSFINKIGSEIVFSVNGTEYNGLYKISGSEMISIVPNNNPRRDKSMYSKPVFSTNESALIFTAPYEIYKMDLEDMNAELIASLNDWPIITGLDAFNNSSKVLFTMQGRSAFYLMDYDEDSLEEIEFSDF